MNERTECDALLVGAGVMSATLGTLLHYLEPGWKISITERLDACALESSSALNNAGTGHSGFCELNYTPENERGEVEIDKAVKVCEAFERSKQFWSFLVSTGSIQNDFIHAVPHISFVRGRKDVDYLRKRWLRMKSVCLFEDMEFSDDPVVLAQWMPLVMKGRDRSVPVAASRMKRGTDIDFGALTRELMSHLVKNGTSVSYASEAEDVVREGERWKVTVKDVRTGERKQWYTRFLFIGAGGRALNLLERSGIPEARHYGGFPVSGQWLICDEPGIVNRHFAKVYGKPELGAPPMSVPHLDARVISGRKCLLFGPYAGFTTKFLKQGSWTDLFRSINIWNVRTIFSAGMRNIPLTRYLIREVTKSKRAKFKLLQENYPGAEEKHWRLEKAGQRVQVIKRVNGKGEIEFGTEVVSSADGSIAALLGASPGASTSVKIMTDLLEKCFSRQPYYPQWKTRLQEAIPSSSRALHEDPEFFREVEARTTTALGLHHS
jgi:malate dehydrogenase (quinone)